MYMAASRKKKSRGTRRAGAPAAHGSGHWKTLLDTTRTARVQVTRRCPRSRDLEWRKHYSIYAAAKTVVAEFGGELAAYGVQRAMIRFPLSESVPVRLIGRIARFRAREVAQRAPR
jgi:hypothetical protein